MASAQSFYVSFGTERDVLPPSRIMDLALAPGNNKSMEVALTWTAPGGDYQEGAAARYEIRTMMMMLLMMIIMMMVLMMMTMMTRYEIRTATKVGYLTGGEFEVKGILVHPSLTPAPGVRGARERGVVRVPWPNQVFYYAVVAIDEVK